MSYYSEKYAHSREMQSATGNINYFNHVKDYLNPPAPPDVNLRV